MTRTQRSASAKPTAEAARTGFATGDVVLVAGLGNPGPSHAGQRHNVGFMALDEIASAHGFGPWRSKFQGVMTEGRVGGKRVILLKPMTYMNKSGQAVGEAARFLKVPAGDVIVIHDELDLAPGKCRIKVGGGHAGHNGLRSIHQHLGPDYARVRIGIGHPGHKDRVTGHVLHDFSKDERDVIDAVLDGVADGFPKLVTGDDAGFQNAVAMRAGPAKPPRAEGGRPPHAAKAAADRAADARAKAEKALADAPPSNPLARLLARFSR